ncbi:MAG: 2-amino-4-hydroxy-6-hydroxymethyldihydropteridine diphosphokinase [Luteolibacter sp.]
MADLVGIALGSNLGDRLANLREACRRLRGLAVPGSEFRSSLVYQTAPQHCPPDSPDFLNAVVELEYTGSVQDLLTATRAIEKDMGRMREGERNAPRTLDLDLLYVGEEECETDDLTLPHPRITERVFVLQPLVDIRPNLVLPGEVITVAEQLAMLMLQEPPLEVLEEGLGG